MNRWLLVLAALVAIVLLGVGVGVARMQAFLATPVTVAYEGSSFEIEPGAPFAVVSKRLQDDGIITSGDMLQWWARWTDQAASVQAGDYLILPGATPKTLLEKFTSGEVQLYSFTIIEGWNYRDLLAALRQHPQISSSMTDEDWPALLEELGAVASHPEGLFLPETYRFPKGTVDKSLLAQAYELMQTTLAAEWSVRDVDSPAATPYEALVLASIIEKETARADEREKIAGVFARRLNQRMRLQMDPTVIYGIGASFNGNLTRRDMRTDTPYNTYTRHGLPPTPIAMPGKAAIHAALHPADGAELYFVATGSGDGSHKFSATKTEHDAAVQEYLQRLRENRR